MFIAFAIHFLTPADGRSGRRHVLHVLSVVTASHDNTQKTSHHAASTYQLKQGWQWGGTSLYGKALPCRFWFCLFDRCCWLRYTQATCVQKETMCFAMTVGFLNEKLCVLPAGHCQYIFQRYVQVFVFLQSGFTFISFSSTFWYNSFPLFWKAGLDTEGGAAITLGTFPVLCFSSVLPAVVLLALDQWLNCPPAPPSPRHVC